MCFPLEIRSTLSPRSARSDGVLPHSTVTCGPQKTHPPKKIRKSGDFSGPPFVDVPSKQRMPFGVPKPRTGSTTACLHLLDERNAKHQTKRKPAFFYLWSFLALVDARKNRQTPVSLHDRHRACACWLADFIYRNPKFLISPHGTCCPLCFAFLFVSVGEMKAIVTSFSFPFSFSLGKSFTKPFFSSFFFLGALRFSFFFSLFSYTLHFTNSWPRWFKVLPFYLTFFFLLPVFALLFLASSWLRIFISLCDRSAHVPRQFLGIQNRTTSTQVGPWYLFYFRSEDDTCLCLSVHPSVRSQTPCPSHAPI